MGGTGQTAGREPWMQGTHATLDALRRGVVHALEQAGEDAERWAAPMTDVEVHRRMAGLPSLAFHLRHTVRSLDRLLTYAEDETMTGGLSQRQVDLLASEMEDLQPAAEVLQEFRDGLRRAIARVERFLPERYEERRGIGRQRLPTTLGGLLVHCAEHSQRHSGQMVLTAKLVRSAG